VPRSPTCCGPFDRTVCPYLYEDSIVPIEISIIKFAFATAVNLVAIPRQAFSLVRLMTFMQ
jgi:hypothetical protein